MVKRKGKTLKAIILLGWLTLFVDTLQMNCDNTTPALGSNLTCTCTTSSTGVEFWSGDSYLTSCSSSGSCLALDGYMFKAETSVYSMTVISYSYLNCAEYKCTDILDSLNSDVKNISISSTSLDLSQTVTMSTPETNSTGNITVQTPCLFIPTTVVQENIQTIWYKVLNDTAQELSSNEHVIEFEDTCQDCSGVRARKLKVTLPYRAPETNSSDETELVEFMFGIFDRNNVSNGQNITSERKFILAKNTMEPRITTTNICTLMRLDVTECIVVIVVIVIAVIAVITMVVIAVICLCKKCKKKGSKKGKTVPVEQTHTQLPPAPFNPTLISPCQDNGSMELEDTSQAAQIPGTPIQKNIRKMLPPIDTNSQNSQKFVQAKSEECTTSTGNSNTAESVKPRKKKKKQQQESKSKKKNHQSTTGENEPTSDKPSSAQAKINTGQTKEKNGMKL